MGSDKMSKIIFALALLAIIGTVVSTTCKDGSSCPGNTTCCMSPQGTVGCCSYENASCCSDGLHCCPNGYTCDLAKGQCVRGNDSFLAFVSMKPATTTPTVGAHFPSIKDLWKCAEDIKPVAEDVYHAYENYKNGKKSEAIELLKKLLRNQLLWELTAIKLLRKLLEK